MQRFTLLVLILIWSFGPLNVSSQETPTPSSFSDPVLNSAFAEVERTGQLIREKIQGHFQLARNPGTLSVGQVDFTSLKQNLSEVEEALFQWKRGLGHLLERPLSQLTDPKEQALLLNKKTAIITFYFTQLSVHLTSKALLDLPVQESWLEKFQLYLTKQTISELTEGELALMESKDSALVLGVSWEEFYQAPMEAFIPIKLSPLQVISLLQSALINTVSEDTYFKLVQYLMVSFEMETLVKANNFLQAPLDLQSFTEDLNQLGLGYGAFGQILKNIKNKKIMELEEQYRALLAMQTPMALTIRTKGAPQDGQGLTDGQRAELREHVEKASLASLAFVDESLIRELLQVLVPPEHQEEFYQTYWELLSLTEYVDLRNGLYTHMQFDKRSLLYMPLEKKVETLQGLYVAAKVSVLTTVLPNPDDLSAEVRDQLATVLFNRAKAYAKSLPKDAFLAWVESSTLDDEFQSKQRQDYSQELWQVSQVVAKKLENIDTLPLDLVLLDTIFEADYLVMGMSPQTQLLKAQIVQMEGPLMAYGRYKELKQNLESELQLVRALRQGNRHDPMGVGQRQLAIMEKQIQDLEAAAELIFGFKANDVDVKDETKVLIHLGQLSLRNVGLEADQRQNYLDFYLNKQLENYRVLLDKDREGKTLFQKLSSMPVPNVNLLNELVESHLQRHARQIAENISVALRAQSTDDLRLQIGKSPLLHQLINHFPAFADHHNKLKESIVAPHFSQMTWDEFYHGVTSKGFMFLLLHTILKWVPGVKTHPLSRAVEASLAPYIRYFEVTALSMVAINAVWKWYQIKDIYEETEELEEHLADGLIDYITLHRSRSEAQTQWAAWKFERKMEVVFLGTPILMRPAKLFYYRLTDRYYASLFETVGFTRGHYRWRKNDIEQMAEISKRSIDEWPAHLKSLAESRKAAIDLSKNRLLKILKRKQAALARQTRHFQEEFADLGMSPNWDPMEVVKQLRVLEEKFRLGIVGEETLVKAIRSSQEILKAIRGPFAFYGVNSPARALESEVLLTRSKEIPGGLLIEERLSTYLGRDFELDPILKKVPFKKVNVQGKEVEFYTYTRILPYLPQTFGSNSFARWGKWIWQEATGTMKEEAIGWLKYFKLYKEATGPERALILSR